MLREVELCKERIRNPTIYPNRRTSRKRYIAALKLALPSHCSGIYESRAGHVPSYSQCGTYPLSESKALPVHGALHPLEIVLLWSYHAPLRHRRVDLWVPHDVIRLGTP